MTVKRLISLRDIICKNKLVVINEEFSLFINYYLPSIKSNYNVENICDISTDTINTNYLINVHLSIFDDYDHSKVMRIFDRNFG